MCPSAQIWNSVWINDVYVAFSVLLFEYDLLCPSYSPQQPMRVQISHIWFLSVFKLDVVFCVLLFESSVFPAQLLFLTLFSAHSVKKEVKSWNEFNAAVQRRFLQFCSWCLSLRCWCSAVNAWWTCFVTFGLCVVALQCLLNALKPSFVPRSNKCVEQEERLCWMCAEGTRSLTDVETVGLKKWSRNSSQGGSRLKSAIISSRDPAWRREHHSWYLICVDVCVCNVFIMQVSLLHNNNNSSSSSSSSRIFWLSRFHSDC